MSFLIGFNGGSYSINGKSMLPTFQEDSIIKMNNYSPLVQVFNPIKRGDTIIFQSGNTTDEETNEFVDYVKRVIALPGDNLIIKNGYIYINDQITDEPYTLTSRSTYGGSFLPECKTINIPNDYVFVMGDNRKHSKDSRDIGLVSLKDIDSRLSLNKQAEYQSSWRESNLPIQDANQPSFNLEEYLEKLNQIRSDKGLKPLKHDFKLDKAAKLRAEAIITYDERNISPQNSKYPMENAFRDASYYNITYGEVINIGYFNAEELLNNWLEFETKDHLLNSEFQETGLAAVIGKIENCEVQIIVQEFGGYIPPNHKQSNIESWESALNWLREILPSWENTRNSSHQNNKDKTERIIQIINIRISRMQAIITRMRANQWLTNEEVRWTKEDQSLYDEQQQLATFLNSQ